MENAYLLAQRGWREEIEGGEEEEEREDRWGGGDVTNDWVGEGEGPRGYDDFEEEDYGDIDYEVNVNWSGGSGKEEREKTTEEDSEEHWKGGGL